MDNANTPNPPTAQTVQLALGATAAATLGVIVLVARDPDVKSAGREALPAIKNFFCAFATSWHRNGGAAAIVFRH